MEHNKNIFASAPWMRAEIGLNQLRVAVTYG